VSRLERAISVKDMRAGLAACHDLRALGHDHGWIRI
jgi:hypothetical protein